MIREYDVRVDAPKPNAFPIGLFCSVSISNTSGDVSEL